RPTGGGLPLPGPARGGQSLARSPLIVGEAVEQARATAAAQRLLAAPARGVRGVPGPRGCIIAQAAAIAVPDHCRALRAASGPVAAGPVLGARERRPVRLRAGEDVVHVRAVADAVHDSPALGERGLLGQAGSAPLLQ